MVRHVPVLAAETIELLAPWRGGCYVDATLGLGGHAEALLESAPAARLFGFDRDAQALELARARLARFGDRVRLLVGRFAEIEALLRRAGVEKVQGILADLGVSSLQLEIAERGFAFSLDGPLDMRMGAGEQTAREIVNCYSEETLVTMFRKFGEEPQARRIARAILDERAAKPIETTGELARLIERVKHVPVRARKGPRRGAPVRSHHPATQVFQALRIEVNRELEELGALLEESVRLLDRDGRLVVITYHSLEDRLVKTTLRDLATGEIDLTTGQTRSETQVIEVLTRKPVRPSSTEVASNPRSRSAKLRAARRL